MTLPHGPKTCNTCNLLQFWCQEVADIAETIVMLKLELADIHCLRSAQGRKWDFLAEVNDGEFF